MRAAVVDSFERAPRWGEFPDPTPQAGMVLITVAAAALSNLVKAQASGKHYSSRDAFPFVPGVDGIGHTPEGERVFFFGPRAPYGSMAERTLVSRDNLLPIPDGLDDVTAAALPNPAIASWGALIGRARLQAGESVLINGATGVSGQQAVQVARYLGAKRIVVTGRNAASLERLRGLGADVLIQLEQPEDTLRSALRSALLEDGGIQVVLDYLWGSSAELLLSALKGRGSPDGEPRVRFIQIGSISGQTIQLSAEWLRSSGVELLGSGLGSISMPEILASLRAMFAAYAAGGFHIETKPYRWRRWNMHGLLPKVDAAPCSHWHEDVSSRKARPHAGLFLYGPLAPAAPTATAAVAKDLQQRHEDVQRVQIDAQSHLHRGQTTPTITQPHEVHQQQDAEHRQASPGVEAWADEVHERAEHSQHNEPQQGREGVVRHAPVVEVHHLRDDAHDRHAHSRGEGGFKDDLLAAGEVQVRFEQRSDLHTHQRREGVKKHQRQG